MATDYLFVLWAGLGALNVCLLEQASADDGLLPLLSLGGHAVQSLVVFTTQLLPESHQQMLNLLMVSFGCPSLATATEQHWTMHMQSACLSCRTQASC
jgi:hypothetical protein